MPKEETIEMRRLGDAIIVKAGVTTQASAGYNIVDVNNITEDVLINYWKDMSAVLLDGSNKGLVRRIVSMVSMLGVESGVTVYPTFPYPIAVGTNYNILANIIAASITTPETFEADTTLHNNTDEQTIFEINAGVLTMNYSLEYVMYLGVSNITKNTTIREYANSLQISSKVYPVDFDPGTKQIALSFETGTYTYKVTMQSTEAEGADIVIPVWYILVVKT